MVEGSVGEVTRDAAPNATTAVVWNTESSLPWVLHGVSGFDDARTLL
jgi:hypothetical protein